MILNLSPNISDIKFTAKYFDLDFESEFIFDCSTLIKLNKANFFSICEIEDFERINEISAKEYIQEIGKLGQVKLINNMTLQQRKVLDHGILWLTNLAVKHPQNSLGKIVYLLNNVLPLIGNRLINDNIYISVPRGSEHYRNVIQHIFNKHHIQNIHLIKTRTIFLKPLIVSSLRLTFFYLKCLIFFSRGTKKSDHTYNNYFITYTNKIVNENYADVFLEDAKKISQLGAYWPFFFSFSSLKKSRLSFSAQYGAALPSFLQLCKLLKSCFNTVLKSQLRVRTGQGNIFADNHLLDIELKSAAVQSMHSFFFGIWLQNFFSRLSHPVNIIYQDEFYETGRIIGRVLKKCKNVTTIGLQHGLFDLHHTVYGMSNLELNDDHCQGVPSPDIFVVWGNYFKRYFLSNNHFDSRRLKVMGSPKYPHDDNFIKISKKKIKKILWCTDTTELTHNDMVYLENTILANTNFEVTIRMHPAYDFLKQYQTDLKIFDRFPSVKLSKSYSIRDDIAIHDLIIVNCFTTAFIDAYLNGKYCLRLYPYKSSPAYLKNYSSQLIFNSYSASDVLAALSSIETNESELLPKEEYRDLMDTDISEWRMLLK